jgi:hypothetical protein
MLLVGSQKESTPAVRTFDMTPSQRFWWQYRPAAPENNLNWGRGVACAKGLDSYLQLY